MRGAAHYRRRAGRQQPRGHDRANTPDDEAMGGVAKIDLICVDADPTGAQATRQISADAR